MGILTMLFNRQILQGLGTDALAVYGVIVNVSTMVQCCAYSVGQAAQPILSASFGAGKWGRIRAALKYALMAAAFFSAVWTLLVFLFPNGFIRIFMSPTRGHPCASHPPFCAATAFRSCCCRSIFSPPTISSP